MKYKTCSCTKSSDATGTRGEYTGPQQHELGRTFTAFLMQNDFCDSRKVSEAMRARWRVISRANFGSCRCKRTIFHNVLDGHASFKQECWMYFPDKDQVCGVFCSFAHGEEWQKFAMVKKLPAWIAEPS